jgi:hypothetical protein
MLAEPWRWSPDRAIHRAVRFWDRSGHPYPSRHRVLLLNEELALFQMRAVRDLFGRLDRTHRQAERLTRVKQIVLGALRKRLARDPVELLVVGAAPR